MKPVLVILIGGLASAALAQDWSGHYEKFEYRIPMRDGVKLYTTAYVPKVGDDGPDKAHPMLMERTPYGCHPYGKDKIQPHFGGSAKFFENRYIIVTQDVRGRFMSEGDFEDVRPIKAARIGPTDADEVTDTYDTIEFLIHNVPRNNGRVGIAGISYPGGYAAMATMCPHPALKAVSPQAPTGDWWRGDDFHHNGALMLQDTVEFFSGFGAKRTGGPSEIEVPTAKIPRGDNAYDFYLKLGPLSNVDKLYFKGKQPFWNNIVKHPNYDAFWLARSLPLQIKSVNPDVLWVGGWYDAEDRLGPLECYEWMNMQPHKGSNSLVVGPWFHGCWHLNESDKGAYPAEMVREASKFKEEIEFPFFNSRLRDGQKSKPLPTATMFDTGTGQWATFDTWPPYRVLPTYLTVNSDYSLRSALTDDSSRGQQSGAYDYLSDPASPVPYQSGKLNDRSTTYMIDDQSFAARRPDVLTLRTSQLPEDKTFAGATWSLVDLYFKSTGTDADFVVKLCDDDGKTLRLVRADVFRTKFRDGFDPVPLKKGSVEHRLVPLGDFFHTFKKGHRIAVQIQSSWFPLVDRNPQTFCDIYNAKVQDFQKATQTILFGPKTPTAIILPLLSSR